MPNILAILCSARRSGYTAALLEAALEGVAACDGVTAERVNLHNHEFGPCRSCFACIRNEDHTCVQDDAFGRRGEGDISARLATANGLLIADPVHNWGPSATCHLFVERCYPFLWSGKLSGMPFASISCASNQGMHRLARANICKWAFGFGMHCVGGLAVHAAHFERARREARELGKQLADAALRDAADGRTPMTDEDRFLAYMDSPWAALDAYLENLTHGTMRYEGSMIQEALDAGTFTKPDAAKLLREAGEILREALAARAAGDLEEANRLLVRASACWTHATWKQFLEDDVIGAKQPDAYRPLDGSG